MLSKAALRQAFRANLARVSEMPSHAGDFASAAERLSKRLTEYLKTQSGIWAGFEPLGFEPDIRSAIESASHIQWAFPRIESASSISFYQISSRSELVKNSLGLLEPDPARASRVPLRELQGLLVPGLAFDHFGNRLGRGRGYYDRLLSEFTRSRLATRQDQTHQPLKIGIALDRQIAEQELPQEPHDIAMDLVITESRFLPRPSAEGPPRKVFSHE